MRGGRVLRKPLLLAAIVLFCGTAPAAAQSETIEYYGTDAVGSVRIVFNASGAVLGRQDYGPFGQQVLSASGMSSERFGGQTADGEVQQAYFHARQLQPRVARFAAPDPVLNGFADPQRWNRYAYGLNNSLKFADLDGLTVSGCVTTWVDAEGDIPGNFHIACPDGPKQPWEGGGGGVNLNLWLFFHSNGPVADSGSGTEEGGVGGGWSNPGRSTNFAPDVTNNGPNIVFAKQEDDKLRNQLIEVKPGTTWKGRQDGIADPCGHPGEVFKSVNGMDVTFSPEGTSTTPASDLSFSQSVKARLAQALLGGWKGTSFQEQHHDWDPLFEISNNGTAKCK